MPKSPIFVGGQVHLTYADDASITAIMAQREFPFMALG